MTKLIDKIDKWIYWIEIYSKLTWWIYYWKIFYNWDEYPFRSKIKDIKKLQDDMTVYLSHQREKINKDVREYKYHWRPLMAYLKTLRYLYY